MQKIDKYQIARNILAKAPKTGLYVGQTKNDWEQFFKFFIAFIISQQGPRGDVIKKSRQILNKDIAKSNKLLLPLGLHAQSSVRDIYVRFRDYSPCEVYDQYLKELAKLEKINLNHQCIHDQGSIMYKSITSGLIQKHGQAYNIPERMAQLQLQYSDKLTSQTKMTHQLQQILIQDQRYHEYMEMKSYFQPILQEWEKVDKQTGNNNVSRGKLFEEKCLNFGLKQIFQKLKNNNYQVFVNCNWNPRSLGEIDIALAEQIEQKLKITVLIQCKSRLFDLSYAYYQIGPQRKKLNKLSLFTKKGEIPVVDDPNIFIMTTLPEFEYILPIESKLKAQLQRLSKNLTSTQIQSQKLYDSLSKKFMNQISPTQWFDKHRDKIIIVD